MRFAPFLLALSMLGAPAAAQDITAMQMQARTMAGREPLGDPVVAHDFAVCVARKQGGTGILEWLPHTNDESDSVFRTSRYGEVNCGPSNRRPVVGARFMRGAAAEYLLKNPDRQRGADIFARPTNDELARLDPDTRSAIVFIEFGECAAKVDPAGVNALLETEVNSDAEAAAFSAVVPAFGGCVPEGLNFGIPPLLLRAYLAEGAYRNLITDQAASQREAAE